jgi:phospholipase/lecithinase/hemolysin
MATINHRRGLLFTLLLIPVLAAPAAAFDNLYVVGDSLSDQGNLFAATSLILGPGNGFPASDHYYQGRFADGGNYVDFLGKRLGVASSPSLLGGNNFAYGGTRTDYNTVEDDATKPFPVSLFGQGGVLPEDLFPWTLNGQREAFAGRDAYDPDALYVVFSGANDLADLTASVAVFAVDPAPVIQGLVTAISAIIDEFVAAGAQDIIVPNMPNLGVVPGTLRYGPDFAMLATTLCAVYNNALDAMLSQWEGATNIIRVDTFSLLGEVVSDPAAFGFANATEPCYTGFVVPGPGETECADPDAYVFWDREHPTAALHAVLADQMLTATVRDMLDDLIQRVASLDASEPTRRPLATTLERAWQAFTNPSCRDDQAAPALIDAFVHVVEARAGEGIAAADAATLVDRAQRLSSLLEATDNCEGAAQHA